MRKALIGIVGKPDNTDDMWSYIEINNEIKECVNKNNALAIGIIPQDLKYKKTGDNEYDLAQYEINDLKEIISKVDGIVLQGGLSSNSYEQEIIKICLEKDLPLLCICCGFNNMVRALGGTLFEEESDIHSKYGVQHVHEVILKQDSKLFEIMGNEKITVNSIHRKVTSPEFVKNCDIVGICPTDNTVEAIEVPNKKFAIGVKWHPELMQDENCMDEIFKKFIESCETN